MIESPDWPFGPLWVADWFETPHQNPWANSFPAWIGEANRLNCGSEFSLRAMPRQKPVKIRSVYLIGARDEPGPPHSGMIR